MGSFYFILQQSRSYYLEVRSENLNFLLSTRFSSVRDIKLKNATLSLQLKTCCVSQIGNVWDNKLYCLYFINFSDKIKCFGQSLFNFVVYKLLNFFLHSSSSVLSFLSIQYSCRMEISFHPSCFLVLRPETLVQQSFSHSSPSSRQSTLGGNYQINPKREGVTWKRIF